MKNLGAPTPVTKSLLCAKASAGARCGSLRGPHGALLRRSKSEADT